EAGGLDAGSVANFFFKGGRGSVISFVRQLRKKGFTSEDLKEVLAAFDEVSGPTTDALSRRRARRESFVYRASRLVRQKRIDAALDLVYSSIDEMLRGDRTAELNSLLEALPIRALSADLLLGILTATLPAKSRMPARAKAFRDIELTLRDRGEY